MTLLINSKTSTVQVNSHMPFHTPWNYWVNCIHPCSTKWQENSLVLSDLDGGWCRAIQFKHDIESDPKEKPVTFLNYTPMWLGTNSTVKWIRVCRPLNSKSVLTGTIPNWDTRVCRDSHRHYVYVYRLQVINVEFSEYVSRSLHVTLNLAILVKKMAWRRTASRLFGVKPLSEPMLTYCRMGP